MKLHRVRGLRSLVVIVGIASLTACTTYVGQKTAPDGALPPGSTGIPFVMTRPEYAVDIAPDANDPTKPVYTLKQTDVPDSNQRYTIALDPALFIDGTFDLSFGENGNLTDAIATTSSTVVATIQSLVQLSIKAAASGAAKDVSSSLGRYLGLVGNSTAPQCTATVKNEVRTFADKLIVEAQVEQRDADLPNEKEKEKASALAASRYHYLTEAQRQCLVAVVPDVRKDADSVLGTAKTAYEKQLKVADATAADASAAKQQLRNVKNAVTSLSIPTLEKLADEVKGPSLKEVAALAALAKSYVQASLEAKTMNGLAELFANMSVDVWRARHLQYIEHELKAKRFALLLFHSQNSADSATLQREISDLEMDRVATLGEPTIVSRIAVIDSFLAQIRTTRGVGAGERFAVDEHVKLREERDKLQARLDQTRTELLAKNKTVNADAEKPKVEVQSNVQVKLVSESFIDKVATNPAGTFGDLPTYILVLKPNPEPAVRREPSVTPKGVKQ